MTSLRGSTKKGLGFAAHCKENPENKDGQEVCADSGLCDHSGLCDLWDRAGRSGKWQRKAKRKKPLKQLQGPSFPSFSF